MQKKEWEKRYTLAQVIQHMSTGYTQLLMGSFIMLRFSYCPLILMCHITKINNQIYKFYELTLRLVYNNKSSSFREFLERHKTVTIHERNIQAILTEISKVKSRNNDRNFQIQSPFI